MDNYASIEKLIDEVIFEARDGVPSFEWGFYKGGIRLDKAKKALLDAMLYWRPAKTPPKNGQDIIVQLQDGEIHLAVYVHGHWQDPRDLGVWPDARVKCWMPRPEQEDE